MIAAHHYTSFCPPRDEVVWIGVAGSSSYIFNPSGISDPRPTALDDRGSQDFEIMPRGSFVVELKVESGGNSNAPLVSYAKKDQWLRGVIISLRPDGRLVVDVVQGDRLCRSSVMVEGTRAECTLRITYGWDAPIGRGILAVEHLEAGLSFRADITDPLPLPMSDARAMVAGDGVAVRGCSMKSLAVARGIAPIGVCPGLGAGAIIDTPLGPRPIETLQSGDLVETVEAGAQPVRHVLWRDVPAVGSLRPLRLRAPFLGLQRDIHVAPDQRIAVGGADAEYLYGVDAVMVEARHLNHSLAADWAKVGAVTRYYSMIFDAHFSMVVNGVAMESLHVSAEAKSPDLLPFSVLSRVPISELPNHHRCKAPDLTRFEARHLVATLYA